MENVFVVIIFVILGSIFLILIMANSLQHARQTASTEAFQKTLLLALSVQHMPSLQCHVQTGVESACIDLLQAEAFKELSQGDYATDAFSLFRRSKILLTPIYISHTKDTSTDDTRKITYKDEGKPTDPSSLIQEANFTPEVSKPIIIYDGLPENVKSRMAFSYPIRAYDPVADVMLPAILTVVVAS